MNPNRTTQSLNGFWDYRIGKGRYCKKKIPYSDAPVGYAECKLEFNLDRVHDGGRVFLVFDGITYKAEVTLNGRYLGDMLPYCEYRYEATELIKQSGNTLSVIIRDTEIVFGAGEGWENYSGITRDVYLEYIAESVMENVFWHNAVSDDLSRADCTVEVATDMREENLFAEVTLCDPSGKAVYRDTVPVSASLIKLNFIYENPLLWSPDNPVLYTLQVTLKQGKRVCDTYTAHVGFKHFVTKDSRFYLNGEPFFLLGICRHEFWGDNGHMITDAQIEEDLRILKDLGCNYVRLVHYPHRKITLDLADEIGLFVSEEPGLWWSDMKDQSIVDASLEVMKRTVLRDRNHISVAFWLSFNECIFTPEYLLASAELCRKYDPYHMVSGANCMDIAMTKRYFKECGFDFYTMHPYSNDILRMREEAEALTDMPLVFTEWGGWNVFDSPFQMRRYIREIVRLWHNTPYRENGEGALTGASLWCFSQLYEHNRAAPVCYDGLQCEYIVDRFRRPSLGYNVFKEEFQKIWQKEELQRTVKITPCVCEGAFTALDLSVCRDETQSARWDAMMEEAAKPIPKFYYRSRGVRNMALGPTVPAEVPQIGDLPVRLQYRPLVITKEKGLTVSVDACADAVHVIGMTSMPHAYPIGGVYGEEAVHLTVCYADGTVEEHAIRNGYELTTACAWYGPSRINPVAANAPRALYVINDPDRERFVVNRICFPVTQAKTVELLHFEITNGDYNMLLYGITIQKNQPLI